ncbi:hypothetical protein [Paraburkholderia gardini]|uniref:Uncharacterized protein n=1 Tax=Paraburkholderia gardini TaxID=2823469 RepID=A0ABM8U9Y2_9BURK|nr:hypothetical protein [Paraburkholderia gardini]CAG4920861.1 hypothetical protein R54767_04756 [Paraburkholderia gardini]
MDKFLKGNTFPLTLVRAINRGQSFADEENKQQNSVRAGEREQFLARTESATKAAVTETRARRVSTTPSKISNGEMVPPKSNLVLFNVAMTGRQLSAVDQGLQEG